MIYVVISKQLYIVKISSYIKEQLKFASFLGVLKGGGQNSPLKSPTLSVATEINVFLMLNFS